NNFPFFLLATVSILHREREANFKPRPNLPRSLSALSSREFLLPYFIASNNSSSSIPTPLSTTVIYISCGLGGESISIIDALAEILLSTISASAASNVYPICLSKFIKILDDGGLLFFILIF